MIRGYRGDIVQVRKRVQGQVQLHSYLAVVERAGRRRARVRPCLQRQSDGNWYSFGLPRRVSWDRLHWTGLCVAGAGRDEAAAPDRPGVYLIE